MTEHVEELAALHALGGLEPDEAARLEAHLATCGACRTAVDREAALVAALALSGSAPQPPPGARARMLARTAAPLNRATAVSRPASWLALPRWVPALLSLALAVLAGWNVYLTREVDNLQRELRWSNGAVALMSAPTALEIELAGQGPAAAASGRAYIDAETHDVVLVVQRLADLPAGQTYQAWLITDSGPVNAGLFEVTDTGWGMTWLDVPFDPGSTIGVSREPAGGSIEPSEVVLLGGL
jgi:anti-sigma-K factor RskA